MPTNRLVGVTLILSLSLVILACPSPTQPVGGTDEPDPPAAPETQVAAPVFSPDPAGGPFGSTLSVSLSSPTEGASIYYVRSIFDADGPDQTSTLFTTPFEVLLTDQYQAIAYKDGLDPSPVTDVTFTITPVPLPLADDFEDGNATGWTLTGGVVDTTMGANATANSIRLTGSGSSLTRNLRGTSASTLQFDIRTDSASVSYAAGYLYNLSLVEVGFGSTGFILEGIDIGLAYSADTWYEIRLELDYINSTVDLYIDDVLRVADHSVVDVVHAGISFTGSDDGEFWVDEIVIQ